jgi:hypothetical protein
MSGSRKRKPCEYVPQRGDWVCLVGADGRGSPIVWLARVLSYKEATEEASLQHYELDATNRVYCKSRSTEEWLEHRECAYCAAASVVSPLPPLLCARA